jgi:magnesium chelatase family protein
LGLTSTQGYSVIVELDIANGLPGFDIVGLPDTTVKESRERVRSAIKNSGYQFPMQKITVNLAPADKKKEGAIYDLPIALGVLSSSEQVKLEGIEKTAFIGELSLDGRIREINGVLPMIISAIDEGYETIVIPYGNKAEAEVIGNIKILAVSSINEVIDIYTGKVEACFLEPKAYEEILCNQDTIIDFSMIRGQKSAKRALEVAAAGGHNAMMIGPPGSGKTMLARALPSILPDLTFDEAIQVNKIHSIAGTLGEERRFITKRPFRDPHHTSSSVSLTGGGSKIRPGEISLAHLGVLFLDELPEFQRNVLEALRQPLEDGIITIARASGSTVFPARVMLIASMNPCPCGNYGSAVNECRCTPFQINRYLNKVSGPLIDRVDIQIEVDAVPYDDLTNKKAIEENSSVVKFRVEAAREIQRQRYKDDNIFFNAQMDATGINKYCNLDNESASFMKSVYNSLHLSARAHSRILKMARTIADLVGSSEIKVHHLAEAINYRSLDRKYWGR